MKKVLIILLAAWGVATNAQPTTSDVWVNEFHYDGVTNYAESDQNEFVEIVVRKTLYDNTVEFNKLKLILYSAGAYDPNSISAGKGVPYNYSLLYSATETEHALNSFQACASTGNNYMILSKQMTTLQDIPAGFALVYDNTSVVQFLSYEKSFKAAPASYGGGPAAGSTSTLIKTATGDTAKETATTPNNHSISLIGSGSSYNNFTWTDQPTQTATPCAENTSQQLVGVPLPVRWLSFSAIGSRKTIFASFKVATETGVSKYVVELFDANGNLATTIDVPYNKNANGSYAANIPNLEPGTYRVRIKSQMLQGDVEYSETKLVRLTGKATQFVSVFPNPIKGRATTLTIIPDRKSSFSIEVVDANGKRISTLKTAELQPNSLNRIEVPMNVAPGVYQLKVVSAHEQQTIKVVVM